MSELTVENMNSIGNIYKYFEYHLNREFFFIFFLISPTSGSFLFCELGYSSDEVEFWDERIP